MKKWILSLDDKQIEYDDFNDCINEFKTSIKEFYQDYKESFKNGIPKSVTHAIVERFNSNDISDDEIVTYERLKMLLKGLLVGDTKGIIERSYYERIALDDDITDIKIVKDDMNIFMELLFDRLEYFKTNAFNLDDDTTYFFEVSMTGSDAPSGDIKNIKCNYRIEPIEEV